MQRGGQGGYNVAANSCLARVLQDGARLARCMNDTVWGNKAATSAKAVQDAMNLLLWDEKIGAFIDNPESTVHPQDGNSLILWFNLTNVERQSRVSSYLQGNWVSIGAISPEWNYEGRPAIGTFPGDSCTYRVSLRGESECR